MKTFIQYITEIDAISTNVNGVNIALDKKANTMSANTNVAGVNMSLDRDVSPGGATSITAKTNVGDVDISARNTTAAYNKGQIGGTSSMGATYTDPTSGDKHNITIDKGIGFGGAGKDVQQGRNVVSTYRKNNMNVATKVGG